MSTENEKPRQAVAKVPLRAAKAGMTQPGMTITETLE